MGSIPRTKKKRERERNKYKTFYKTAGPGFLKKSLSFYEWEVGKYLDQETKTVRNTKYNAWTLIGSYNHRRYLRYKWRKFKYKLYIKY